MFGLNWSAKEGRIEKKSKNPMTKKIERKISPTRSPEKGDKDVSKNNEDDSRGRQ
jgi:hypothetical protein